MPPPRAPGGLPPEVAGCRRRAKSAADKARDDEQLVLKWRNPSGKRGGLHGKRLAQIEREPRGAKLDSDRLFQIFVQQRGVARKLLSPAVAYPDEDRPDQKWKRYAFVQTKEAPEFGGAKTDIASTIMGMLEVI